MNSDDRQRTMDFILDQQAQFAAGIQELRDRQKQLLINQEKSEARIDQIEEVILRTVGVVERLAESLDRLAESQAQTDARLNIFINVVERHITESMEGHSE